MAIAVLSVAYSTYEMHRAASFYDHQMPRPVDDITQRTGNRTSPRVPPRSVKYFDKYGSEVTELKYFYLVGQEQVDKGMCVALTFVSVIDIVASALIIRGARISDKRAYVPWVVIVVAVMALGVMHVLFNIVTLDFNGSVNFVLFLWIICSIFQFHCIKRVVRTFRNNHDRSLREGMAIFDARQLNHDLFTVTDGQLRPTASPVRIVLKPPTYDEALHELEELGPPPDPPDSNDVDSPTDKPPPDYVP